MDQLVLFQKFQKISEKCKIIVFDRHGYKKKSLNSTTFKELDNKNLKFIEYFDFGTNIILQDIQKVCSINKEVINKAGFPFTGHTEELARLSNTKKVVMMLASNNLRVALLTTHIALKLSLIHI